MKLSEARILMYIHAVDNTNKNLGRIASKLSMDYAYCIRIIQQMMARNWIFRHRVGRRVFYDLTQEAPIEDAKERLANE